MPKYRSDLSAVVIWTLEIFASVALMAAIAFVAAAGLTFAGMPR